MWLAGNMMLWDFNVTMKHKIPFVFVCGISDDHSNFNVPRNLFCRKIEVYNQETCEVQLCQLGRLLEIDNSVLKEGNRWSNEFLLRQILVFRITLSPMLKYT